MPVARAKNKWKSFSISFIRIDGFLLFSGNAARERSKSNNTGLCFIGGMDLRS